jgi:arylsulfatase A-like enzyme
LYDEGTHVPFIVRGPGITKGIRDDLIEQIDIGPIALGKAGIPIPATMHGKDVFAEGYQKREAVFAARDRCDETVDRIRSVRTERYLYIRNFFPNRPLLQPNLYKDGKAIVQKLRELHEQGQLESQSTQILFSPTRPSEELYEWKTDRWQIKNLADEATHKKGLIEMRNRLDQWIIDTKDQGLEASSMYDSDMAVYLISLAKGNLKELEENIRMMKQWAAEGK